MRALTLDVLVEFVVLVCGALGAFSDISEFEAVEVDLMEFQPNLVETVR